jgi:hypothetical protein
VHDQLVDGRSFWLLTVINDYNSEGLVIEVDLYDFVKRCDRFGLDY